jgi:hypothetical protein
MLPLEINVITYQTTRCPAMWLLSRCPHSSGKSLSLTFPQPLSCNSSCQYRLPLHEGGIFCKTANSKDKYLNCRWWDSRHFTWKLCTSPVRRSAGESQRFLWLAGRHVGPACRPTASHSGTVNDWRLVECDAVRSGKDLPAFRRIVVLLFRVKQLSLNCFTLKVKAVPCFETSVARSNVPDDFDLQLLSDTRHSLWTVSAISAVMSFQLRPSAIQSFVVFLVAVTQIAG